MGRGTRRNPELLSFLIAHFDKGGYGGFYIT